MPVETRYYEQLGIQPAASSDEIKKAYRKLSLRWHPDKNPTNRTEAEERFKLLAEAYSVLSDPETRDRYDRYGEAGLKRGFQPGGPGQSHAGGGYHSAHGGGPAFRSADDIFREFFGGRDPFASMFMGSMQGGDPFGDPFFAQPASGGGSAMYGERERRPYAGSAAGPAPVMQDNFASPFGGFPSMGFVSSSTVGGSGGLRGTTGPATRTSIQMVNGVKIQTVEEDDGCGTITVTRISPDGTRDVTVNGVPQSSRKNIADSAPQHHRRRRSSSSGSYSRTRPQAEPAIHVAPGRRPKTPVEDDDSVVEVEIIDVDAEPSPPPPPKPKRRETNTQGSSNHGQTKASAAAAAVATGTGVAAAAGFAARSHARAPLPNAQRPPLVQQAATAPAAGPAQPSHHAMGPRDMPTHAPPPSAYPPPPSAYPPPAPRNDAEDILTSARNSLKPLHGTPAASARERSASMGPEPHPGIKEKLQTNGANMLKSRPRPRQARAYSASKSSLASPPPTPVPPPQSSRVHGPVYRPEPLVLGGPRPAQQLSYYGMPAPGPAAGTYSRSTAGYSTPGNKQPRSRDRMRSTLHYDPVAVAQYGQAAPPPPQRPLDPQVYRAPVPNQYQPPYYGTDPRAAAGSGQGGAGGYAAPGQSNVGAGYQAGQPLSASQARNMQRQQSQEHQHVPPGAAAVGGPSGRFHTH
ncbi:DnaJ sub B member 8 [Coemansia sp. RSA 552]|nr:DnaJ sub B member 8 [Coemansia sp. RSA 552]